MSLIIYASFSSEVIIVFVCVILIDARNNAIAIEKRALLGWLMKFSPRNIDAIQFEVNQN